MEYAIGDCVVHPSYGGGTIKGIKEKSFFNHSNQYYEIHMPLKNMTIMVPVEKAEEIGVRPVSSEEELDEMWALFAGEPEELADKYQVRQEGIRTQLKTGDLLTISKALRDLLARQETHNLTQADRGLREQAESFIAYEISLATDMTLEEIKEKIRETVGVCES